jgi:hypothetical protein
MKCADRRNGTLAQNCLDVKAQRRISVSQAIISAKAKSLECYKVLYEEEKKVAVKL